MPNYLLRYFIGRKRGAAAGEEAAVHGGGVVVPAEGRGAGGGEAEGPPGVYGVGKDCKLPAD